MDGLGNGLRLGSLGNCLLRLWLYDTLLAACFCA